MDTQYVRPEHDGRDPFEDGVPVDFTDIEHQLIESWVRASADILGLRGWRIWVSRFSPDKDAIASSFIREASDEAYIALEQGWRKTPEYRLRGSLVHELLHLHLQREIDLFRRLITNELGTRTEAVIMEAVKYQQELIIERLAWGISALLPPLHLKEAPNATTG